MIKYVQCVRRHPDLDPAEFRSRWDDYIAIVRRISEGSGATRLTSGFSLVHEQNALIQSDRGTAEPFDAVVEVWWTSGANALAHLGKEELNGDFEALQKLQPTLIDLEHSSFFFIDEELILGD